MEHFYCFQLDSHPEAKFPALMEQKDRNMSLFPKQTFFFFFFFFRKKGLPIFFTFWTRNVRMSLTISFTFCPIKLHILERNSFFPLIIIDDGNDQSKFQMMINEKALLKVMITVSTIKRQKHICVNTREWMIHIEKEIRDQYLTVYIWGPTC